MALGVAGCPARPELEPARELAASPAAAEPRPVGSAGEDPASCFVGVVTAERVVDVSAQVEGRLAELPVALGAEASRGRRLATIDARPLMHQLEAERARLEALRAAAGQAALDSRQARRDLELAESLTDLLAAAEVESARFDVESKLLRERAVAAEVEEARLRVAALEEQAARREITAPFDGTVAWVYLSPGTVVRPGDRILRLVAAGRRLVRFAIPPSRLAAVQPGTEIGVRARGGDTTTSAVVETVSPEIDAASRLVFVQARLALEQPAEQLPLGAAVAVASPAGEIADCKSEV